MSVQKPAPQGLQEARNLAEDVPAEVAPDPPARVEAQVEPQPEQALQVLVSFTLVSFTRISISKLLLSVSPSPEKVNSLSLHFENFSPE